jgi:hypothetical protein
MCIELSELLQKMKKVLAKVPGIHFNNKNCQKKHDLR